jgi:hypothetical protein
MRAPENWWRFTGLILNFVGAMTLLWHSWRVMWITPDSRELAFNPFVSPWWWYLGLGLTILGFGLQLVSQVYGRNRQASAAPESALTPARGYHNEGPDVSGQDLSGDDDAPGATDIGRCSG